MKIAHKIAGAALACQAIVGCASGGEKASVVQAPTQAAPKSAEAWVADGNEAFRRGDHAAALSAYDQALKRTPGHRDALFNRAVALHRTGKLDDAQVEYEEILASHPKDTRAALNLGAVYREKGKPGRAIAVYEKALKHEPFHADILNNLSVLYRQKKQYERAVRALRTLLQRDQNNVAAYKNLGLVYVDQKKYRIARSIFEKAQSMAEAAGAKDADILVNLGLVFLAQEKNGPAMAAFKEALKIDPKHAVANYNTGFLALAHRDYALAEKSYRVVAAAWPESGEAAASLGYALQGLGKKEEAAKQLETARSLYKKYASLGDPRTQQDDEQIVYQLMVIWQEANNADRALEYGDEYLRMKGMTCGAEDFDGVCGRYQGIKLMKQMNEAPAEEAASQKPKAAGIDVFTDEASPEAAPAAADGAQGTAETAPPADAGKGQG